MVAAAEEKLQRGTCVHYRRADLVTVVVVRDLFAAREQGPTDAVMTLRGDHVERLDVRQRRGDPQVERAGDRAVDRGGDVVRLLVPHDLEVPDFTAPRAIVGFP